MFDGLLNLFSGKERNTAAADGGNTSVQLTRNELLDHFAAIQSQASGIGLGEAECSKFFPHKRLQLRLQTDDVTSILAEQEKQLLLFVRMLFEFVREDPNIPFQLRPVLAMLETPYTRLSLLDERFTREESHPGWMLLDKLVQVLRGWSPEFENAENTVRRRVELAIGRVLTEFDEDIQELQRALDDLSASFVQEQRASKANEERTLRTLRGTGAVVGVQQAVYDEVAARLENNPGMPKAVEVLLRDVWKNVLLKTGLSSGMQSESWKKAVRFMDSLLWSVSPDTASQRREKLTRFLPVLNKELRRGLNFISYDEEKKKHLLASLRQLHVACMRGQNVWGTGKEQSTTVILGGSSRSAHSGSPSSSSKEHDFLWIARSLPEGSWIELRSNDRTQQRMKLIWKGGDHQQCLFVDRQGNRCAEYRCDELAEKLKNLEAVVLSDTDKPFRKRFLQHVRSLRQGAEVML